MTVKLIREFVDPSNFSFLKESVEGSDNKKLYVEGIFMVGDTVNKNNRRYPGKYLEEAALKYIKEKINNSCAYGELGHPPSPIIDPNNIAIHHKSLRKEGNNWIGKALVASTPKGDIVRGLISDGANLGISSRGLGSLKPVGEGINEVQDDFFLATPGDIVTDPSAPDAFVQGIMENVEYWFDAAKGTWVEDRLDDVKQSIKKMTLEEISQKRLVMFESFLNGLIPRDK